ncbi:MetQ/NlpA family ABC transporter substrate-binding protein [Methylobacterium aerolatum]|uniref:D-methionine transport system substrate-binding protein n=1 Tax=Methylobacterium aerolatum TaxID=418708 RepID=A0ABU0I4T1_9HYPH|nr:MetQ/NlpA family ABC transporter substrate-binding protein [Methylobacterium aerolatum]MDQ0449626.1 D-methionine transport system substrate-binding protein [Methylobacterium aerolatum]GJD36086.1 D-methionine-binding lipoprotein MetQ [Methylobacterium aerolatum]
MLRALTLAALLALTVPAQADPLKRVRIGATPGPHAQILEAVKPVAAKKGLDLQIVEFSDYVIPNEALASGELEANSFQHQPYLDNQKADRGYKIVSVATTVNFPLGIYSKKHKSFDAVPTGGTLAIPNDPTNGGRALLLLQDKGIITLKPGIGLKPSVADIVGNPRKLRIIEVEAALTARSLDDVDAAAINGNYATPAGFKPSDAILKEDPKGPYANVIAVREADKDQPWVKALVESYQTPETRAFIEKTFGSTVLASW